MCYFSLTHVFETSQNTYQTLSWCNLRKWWLFMSTKPKYWRKNWFSPDPLVNFNISWDVWWLSIGRRKNCENRCLLIVGILWRSSPLRPGCALTGTSANIKGGLPTWRVALFLSLALFIFTTWSHGIFFIIWGLANLGEGSSWIKSRTFFKAQK